MAMRKADKLPQEIIIEILSRLPAKFIGRCRCVSKHWLNFLSDPQFIKGHQNIHARKEEEEKLIWVSGSNSLRISTCNHNHHNATYVVAKKLNFQHLSDNWESILGSCNGLVLLENEEEILFLINPITLTYHTIPKFHLALPVNHSFSMSGLGYDVATDDYKVVSLSLYDDTYDNDNVFVDVYSVRKGLWRRLECLPHDYVVEELASGVLVNGALHWLATKISDRSCVIVAFDLSGEKFLEVPAPPTLDKGNKLFNRLVAHRGCLCMSTDTKENKIDFWMMKEYGVESWTKINFIVPNSLYIPLHSMNEDGVVFNVYGDWIVYMKEDQSSNTTVVEPICAVTFMESLINPTFRNGT